MTDCQGFHLGVFCIFDVKYLTEALGLFPHQNDIAEMLSNIAYDMISFDINIIISS